MLLITTPDRADVLHQVIDREQSGSRRVSSRPHSSSPAKELRVVQVATQWRESARNDEAGGSGIATATDLWPGELTGDDPINDAQNISAITAFTAPNQITIDAGVAARLVVGATVTITGTSYDDGDARVLARSAGVLTLDRDLQMTSASGSVYVPGSWKLMPAEQTLTAVCRDMHSVLVVGRVGGEWLVLNSPEAWVLLDDDLRRATVASSHINYSTAPATVLIDDGAGLIESEETLTVSSADESLVAAANTLLRVRLCGSRWIVIWTACVASKLR